MKITLSNPFFNWKNYNKSHNITSDKPSFFSFVILIKLYTIIQFTLYKQLYAFNHVFNTHILIKINGNLRKTFSFVIVRFEE